MNNSDGEVWVKDHQVDEYLKNGYELSVDESFIKTGVITKSCKLGNYTLMKKIAVTAQ